MLITPCPARVAIRLNSPILSHKCYCTHHLPVEEVWKTGSMRLTHSTALSRNMWSAVSSKAPMRPPTTRMLVSNRLMRRLELHFKLVLTHSLALCLTLQECHSYWQNRHYCGKAMSVRFAVGLPSEHMMLATSIYACKTKQMCLDL